MTALIKETTAFFHLKFGNRPETTVLSPGRINIIDEHVDYNDGFVLPAAIDKSLCFVFARNGLDHCRIAAIDLDDMIEISTDDLSRTGKAWANYLIGVLRQLQEHGYSLECFDCAFSSNIPVGSGLSSSAALECGFLWGIDEIFALGIDRVKAAQMGQSAEHWVGINCGIMDQFANMLGAKNKVIRIDCRSLEYEYHSADFSGYSLLLFDTNVKHSLFSSAYNQRREECELGVSIISKAYPGIKSLRDCSMAQLESVAPEMPENVLKRCHFVIGEIGRVVKACAALDRGDITGLGELMFQSHDGLSAEYEVSCDESDFLVNCAKESHAVIGARQMGGGFGGCTINLVRNGYEEEIKRTFSKLYRERFGIALEIYDVSIADGTRLYTE